MKELYGVTTLTAVLVGAIALLGGSQKIVAAPSTGIKNVVLVHGAFADGSTSDRSINPNQERMMAKRAHAQTVEVNASHVAYMSHPKEAAKLIEDAATSAHVNQ
jgi:hypothetical protein